MSETKNKKALFRFLRHKKIVPPPINLESACLSAVELVQSLETVAKGLECRFTSVLPYHLSVTEKANEYKAATLEEITEVVKSLPGSAPGPDNITAAMIKIMFDLSPIDLCNFLNFSIENAWIHPDWKVAKVVPLLKNRALVMQ